MDFTRSIHAITLFGRGYGSLIEPTEASIDCHYWSALPPDKFYLAASAWDLNQIMDMYGGDPYSRPPTISEGISWFNPGAKGSQCRCANGKKRFSMNHSREHTEFAQVLLPTKVVAHRYSANQPFTIDKKAAVVFGHNITWPWLFKDFGHPEYAAEGGEGQDAMDIDTKIDEDSSLSAGRSHMDVAALQSSSQGPQISVDLHSLPSIYSSEVDAAAAALLPIQENREALEPQNNVFWEARS